MGADGRAAAFAANFLGNAPGWYKASVLAFLLANPLLTALAGGRAAGWALLAEFVFCLWHARRCYPLQPAGLLALEAAALGLTTTSAIYDETLAHLPLLLLLVFLMAAVHFMRELLCAALVEVLLAHRSKTLLSVATLTAATLLSALVDALTLVALAVGAVAGVYAVVHQAASGGPPEEGTTDDDELPPRSELAHLRAFLRSLLVHGAVGAAVGGAATAIGEPANILLGSAAGLSADAFTLRLAPVAAPAFAAALVVCVLLERAALFGFGTPLPEETRTTLARWRREARAARDAAAASARAVQTFAAALLLAGLVMRVTEVGVVALALLIVQTALNGVTEEKRLGHAFEAGLPFTALLVVLFALLTVVREQGVFAPVLEAAVRDAGAWRDAAVFLAAGVLAAFSDAVFVAAEGYRVLSGAGALTGETTERLLVALAGGTNLASLLAPAGHVAVLFLVTSSLARLVRLSYPRAVWMCLPYAIATSGAAITVLVLPR